MSIEHRYTRRHTHDIAVQIQYRNRHFCRARGRNVSAQGMYLEVKHVTLPTGTLVVLNLRESEREWSIPAIVVHQDMRGIGVMFRDLQPELLHASTATFCAPPPRVCFEGSAAAGRSAA